MVFTSYLLFKISYILHEIMFFPIAWTSSSESSKAVALQLLTLYEIKLLSAFLFYYIYILC